MMTNRKLKEIILGKVDFKKDIILLDPRQVGSEVSYNELAQIIGADKATVSAYIDLLEKVFVIFRLIPFPGTYVTR